MAHSKVNYRKWVDALRSGEYQQVTGQLGTGNRRCAVGVAFDIAIKEGMKTSGNAITDMMLWFSSVRFGTVNVEGFSVSVMQLNDQRGWSFEKIADALEATYLTDEGPEDEPTGSGDDSNAIPVPDDVSSLTGELVPV